MAAIDQLTGLMTLLNGVNGKSQTTKTSGGTSTQQTNVSGQGIQEILNQILSGSGGVKDIGSRARSSGLYNSTSEDLLLGNLYATAANKAELARSPTVTTTAPQTQVTTTPGTGIGGLAGTLGTAFLASQALNLGTKALAPTIESGSNYITDLLGGLFGTGGGDVSSPTGSSKKSGSILDGIDFGGFGGQIGGTSASSGTGFSSGEGYGINTSTLGNFGGSSGVSDAKGLNFGMDLDSGSGSVGIGGFGAIGSILGSVLGGLAGSSGGSSSGGGGGSSGGSVICTALKDRGMLDRKLHAAGEKYLNALPVEVKIGYQSWAIEIAEKIAEGHEGWTKVCCPVARSRTNLLASSGSFIDHLKYPLGTLTKFIGEPICGMIGKQVMRKVSQFKGV
ncbi:MAG: hypothetical protein [Bacteriophage sp.]|nr:MAG: hypothetical protein [Bacteriophage sp.]